MVDEFYNDIRNIIISEKNKIYRTNDFRMVKTFWNIGKRIVYEVNHKSGMDCEQELLEIFSKQLIKDFGERFTTENLKNKKHFYLSFPDDNVLSDELSWRHYRILMSVYDEKARNFYLNEAIEYKLSTRQLSIRIDDLFYEKILFHQNREEGLKEMKPSEIYEYIFCKKYELEFLKFEANEDFYEAD